MRAGDHISATPTRKFRSPTHLLGGAGIHTLSVTADGGCRPAMAMVSYFTTKRGASDKPFHRRELRLTPHATKSKYMLEENEHKQVTEYHEASTYLLSPYLFSFRCFFRLRITMRLVAIQFNSIGPVSQKIRSECYIIHFYNHSWAHTHTPMNPAGDFSTLSGSAWPTHWRIVERSSLNFELIWQSSSVVIPGVKPSTRGLKYLEVAQGEQGTTNLSPK